MLDKSIIEKATSYRRHLHQNPELSYQEYNTSDFIESKLREFGIKTFRPLETGVVGVIGEGETSIALRADIDALPVAEDTGLEFASRSIGVMHACGHDFHTASLLAAAEILKSKESELNGKIYLIFQPAEEKLPGGAKLMLDAKIFGDSLPKYIFAWHIFPQEEVGTILSAPGYVMAATDELYIDVIGKSAHAADPHLGCDPIIAASELVLALQSIISRNRNPLFPAVLTIASFNGGNTTNVIPGKVELKGTIRTYQPEFRAQALKRIEDISRNICEAHDCEVNVNIVHGYPALKNDAKAVELFRTTAKKIFGESKLKEFTPKMWAEDFAYFAEQIPACFFYLGVKSKTSDIALPPLHHPSLSPSESVLDYSIELITECAISALNEK